MEKLITDLVEDFDRGTLSRRQLIQGLTALAAAGGAALPAVAQQTPFKPSRIDHISVQTTNLARSIDFYSKVFGLKVLNEDKENKIARMGVTKIIVSLHEKAPVGIVDHFAIAIDDFDKGTVTAELAKLGLKAEENLDYGFYVRDPEGVPVQIVKT
jgi:catechol 2,3-dioxygenase-like lactoylglutathione lyase family enzyme